MIMNRKIHVKGCPCLERYQLLVKFGAICPYYYPTNVFPH